MGPSNGGAAGLMDRLVRDTEQTINRLVERRKSLEAELVMLKAEEAEARGVLQFLKKEGNSVKPVPVDSVWNEKKPRKKRKPEVSRDDFLAAIDAAQEDSDDWTAFTIAEIADMDPKNVATRLRKMSEANDYIRISAKSVLTKNGRTPTYYRKLKPPV